MAMLAARSVPHAHPAPLNMSSYRSQSALAPAHHGTVYASPTDSDFSDTYYVPDNVRNWDERRVSEWLRTIKADKYIDNFRANNITGENLMDIDQAVLKEMGVKKIGDRVRIASQAKLFRHNGYRRQRSSNRDSLATLDSQAHTPPSSASPRPPRSANPPQPHPPQQLPQQPLQQPSSRQDKPFTRNNTDNTYPSSTQLNAVRNTSRPASPMYNDPDPKMQRANKYITPRDAPQPAAPRPLDTPRAGQFRGISESPYSSYPQSAFQDRATTNSGLLPPDKAVIRVIFDNANSSVFGVEGCRTVDDIVQRTLKKGNMSDSNSKNYCFYVLNGTEPNYTKCRKLFDPELFKICTDTLRPERERLMFLNVHLGVPEGAQLITAANIAKQQMQQTSPPTALSIATRSQLKIQKLTGESLPSLSYPMSPASVREREQHLNSAALDLERPQDRAPVPRQPRELINDFHGGRPPSEFVVADPSTYFPGATEEIERTKRIATRRSQRLSRATSQLSRLSTATSRLSIVSTFSVASKDEDVPAVPSIPNTWIQGTAAQTPLRPLSIMRMGRPQSSYRESIISTSLDPLEEESPSEPNRKSYVSFGGESAPDSATVSVSDVEGNSGQHSYFEDAGSSPPTEASGSLNEQLNLALAEDGEEADEELNDFLNTNTYDNIKYIRGKLIGQGSFGSVYLALHSVTAELMAVKQVELPSTAGTAADARKNNMVEALKREIALLREVEHDHIVKYLGSSSEEQTLNIFLEYIPGGSIAKMLVDYGSLNEPLVTKFVGQILVGLAYLHSRDIIHRDIKGANVLVDNHGKVKISDFGISKRVQDSKNLLNEDANAASGGKGAGGRFAKHRVSLQGSVFWMAPEVVQQTAYTRKADIWSLGCLVVEMLTGSHPHPNCTQIQAIFKIGGKGAVGSVADPTPEMPAKASKEARDFLKATFRVEHEKRPEAEALKAMPFAIEKVRA